jgi:hypothetical protein
VYASAYKAQQLPVIIQHFFEVRYMPNTINRVAGKAAANMVINATKAIFFSVSFTFSAKPSSFIKWA